MKKILVSILMIFTTYLYTQELKTDIIVVGAGGAGLSAAIEAADLGAGVIIVEKMSFVGGNTLRSKGGLNAADTSTQKKLGIIDTISDFYNDTMKGGKNINNSELVKYLTENSADSVEWLKSIGMNLESVGSGAGAKNPRMHRSEGGASIGGGLVKVLFENVEKREIPILYNTQAIDLITKDNRVVGIVAEDVKTKEIYKILGNSVVIATGGFAGNEAIYTKYREDLKGFISTNHPGADGSGILLAQKVGGDVVDMEHIQTNPTVEQNKKEVISETVRGAGAIFVNNNGERFINEMETRDKLSEAILKQNNGFVYLLFDQNLKERVKAVDEMEKINILIKGDSLEELGKKLSISPSKLSKTLYEWNNVVMSKDDKIFLRQTGLDYPIEKGPFYAIPVGPGVHHTMGGIKINSLTNVLDKNNNIIKGLYAAGEVTGGVHGANRLGGNAVADIIIFGRQSGRQSVLSISKEKIIGGENTVIPLKKDFKKINPTAKPTYRDGKYIGSATGQYGKIVIETVVKNGYIDSINTLESSDTEIIYEGVEREIFPKIIYTQNLDVDMVGGATVSSRAVISAVKKALKNK